MISYIVSNGNSVKILLSYRTPKNYQTGGAGIPRKNEIRSSGRGCVMTEEEKKAKTVLRKNYSICVVFQQLC